MLKIILNSTLIIIGILALSGCNNASQNTKQADWETEELNIKKNKPQNKSIKQASWE